LEKHNLQKSSKERVRRKTPNILGGLNGFPELEL